MKSSGSNGPSKVDRKTVEKNRRIHMKTLCFKLGSLIPNEERNTRNVTSQHDHLDHAVAYINNLKARIEKLKLRKKSTISSEATIVDKEFDYKVNHKFGLPTIEVRHRDTILEVVLITGVKKKLMFCEVIGVIVEEGAEVVNASFSAMNDKIFYTIHSQAISPRIGIDASRISERLKELIQ